ncbi:hypothetical protein B0H14DRAFT_3874901 [Mycena olivaceomarginata]|nr:hypothetical protein B0H14DRAFT_3874901 [Mycena olivaceomarginata]
MAPNDPDAPLRTLALDATYRYVTDDHDMPEVLPPLILAAAPSLRDASNAAIGASHMWLAAFLLPPSSHRQDRYITDDGEGPDARSALVDRCAILAPADFASRSSHTAGPTTRRIRIAFSPRLSFCRLPTVSTPLHVLTDPKILVPLSAFLVPQSALAALTLVLELKHLTDDRGAPDTCPVLILAAAPSLRGLTLHLDPRTALDTPSAANGTQSASRPCLAFAACTSATASTRSSAPDILGTNYYSPPPAPCVSATTPVRSSPLIGASLAWIAAPLLLPTSDCPRHPPPPSWRIINSGPLNTYIPGPTRRHTVALGVASITDDSAAPDARSALVLGAAPSLRELTLHISISVRLPPFVRLRPYISARPRRAIGASLALLAHFPFPVSSHLSLFQSVLRNPSGPGQQQRARGPLPRRQHAARRPPRRRAIEVSAADAEAGDARAPSSPPPTPLTPLAPALALPRLPTHGLRKASDLPKARDSTGEGRPACGISGRLGV